MASKERPNGYWNDPKSIDKEFDELVETLRRVPNAYGFEEKYGEALARKAD